MGDLTSQFTEMPESKAAAKERRKKRGEVKRERRKKGEREGWWGER